MEGLELRPVLVTSLLASDHLTGAFVQLIGRCEMMLLYGMDRVQIAEQLIDDGIDPIDAWFAFCAATMSLSQRDPIDVVGRK